MFDYDPGPIQTNVDPGQLTFAPIQGAADYGPGLTAFGGGYAAASTLLASSQSARYLRMNAAIAGQQARGEEQSGAEAADLYRQHLDQTIGRQTASIGGSNVTMSGSPLRSLESTASMGARDIAQIQTNAARKAWGFSVTQAGDEARAADTSAAGSRTAFGGLITTGARAYGQWSGDD